MCVMETKIWEMQSMMRDMESRLGDLLDTVDEIKVGGKFQSRHVVRG